MREAARPRPEVAAALPRGETPVAVRPLRREA